MFLSSSKVRNSHMKVLCNKAALKKFPKFTRNSYPVFLVAGKLQTSSFIKKRFPRKCLPVKFLRTFHRKTVKESCIEYFRPIKLSVSHMKIKALISNRAVAKCFSFYEKCIFDFTTMLSGTMLLLNALIISV